MGQYPFPKRMLAAYREAVVDDEQGRALEHALATLRAAGPYEVGGEHYKRVPRGYDTDHPPADLLRYAGLYAYIDQILPEVVCMPVFVELCFAYSRNMALLHQWLVGVSRRIAG